MIAKYSYGTFEANDFVIGTTNKNEYFPVYSLFQSDFPYDFDIGTIIVNDIRAYKKPRNQSHKSHADFNRYTDLFSLFENCVEPKQFEFSYDDETHRITCMKGYIADKADEILVMLTTNSFSIFDDRSNIIPDKLRLYVSTELLLNPIYKNLQRKIEKELIMECHKQGIEVFFTTSEKIEKSTFSNDFEISFNNFTELNDHLNSGIGDILFFDEQEYINRNGLNPLFNGTEPEVGLFEEDAPPLTEQDEPSFISENADEMSYDINNYE